ncbi:lasso peptide biosynthesis B2 protein [Hyphococcus sp.]|uniref:lasso peptide biosynthesis B2 protein n=1 Tax=Hyphococcus sp. TaxID=2038636 RepID=UPI0035C760D9
MSQHKLSSSGAGFRSLRLVVLAWFSLLFFRLALSVAGYNAAKRLLKDQKATLPPASPAFAHRTAVAINQAAQFIPHATCLVRSMAAKFLLDRKSYGSSICVGVAKETGAPLQAHAWLKSGDLIIIGNEERQLSRYAPLARMR